MSMVITVAAGGALGALGRYLVMSWLGHRLGSGFPWGTLCVNVSGSALLGAFLAVTSTVWPAPVELRLFVAVGVLGAFTTFSTFALDVAFLYGEHRRRAILFYVFASVALSLLGAIMGYHFLRALLA